MAIYAVGCGRALLIYRAEGLGFETKSAACLALDGSNSLHVSFENYDSLANFAFSQVVEDRMVIEVDPWRPS
jgi:hypothetical protein